MLILYTLSLVAAMYWVYRTLAPELAKPPLPKVIHQSIPVAITEYSEPVNRIEKLETMLAEKNKNIKLLQDELKIFHVQVRDFNKIQTLLEGEIHRLREQNRIFRSELGMPTVQLKENSIN